MKIAKTALIAALVSCMGAAPAGAAIVDHITVTDITNGLITITGTPAAAGEGEETVITFMQGDGSIDDGTLVYEAGKRHVDVIQVPDGEAYSYTFQFQGESGDYRVFVKRGSEVYDDTFALVSADTIRQVFADLAGNKIPADEIFELLTQYQSNLGIDLSGFVTADDIMVLENVIYDDHSLMEIGADQPLSIAQAGLQACMQKAQSLIKLYAGLEETTIWNQVSKLLQENAELLDIDLDGFLDLSNSGQKSVCEQFVGETFTSALDIKNRFEDAVSDQKQQDNSSHTGGSGGGGGGSSYRGGGSSTVDRYYNQELLETPSTLGPGEIVPDGPQFTDMDNTAWAQEAVTALAESGIINGVAEGIFDPDGILTREQAAKIVVLAFGLYDEMAEAPFTDVPGDNWAYRYVASAKEAGIMLGVSDTEFGAGQAVTRQDLATLLYRAAGSDLTTPSTDFADFADVADYAKEAVSYMAGAGIINGMGENLFAPLEPATRAQAAKMIYELMGGAGQ